MATFRDNYYFFDQKRTIRSTIHKIKHTNHDLTCESNSGSLAPQLGALPFDRRANYKCKRISRSQLFKRNHKHTKPDLQATF